VFGASLDKSQQTSDWQVRPLSFSQLKYAALDARVLVALFDALFRNAVVVADSLHVDVGASTLAVDVSLYVPLWQSSGAVAAGAGGVATGAGTSVAAGAGAGPAAGAGAGAATSATNGAAGVGAAVIAIGPSSEADASNRVVVDVPPSSLSDPVIDGVAAASAAPALPDDDTTPLGSTHFAACLTAVGLASRIVTFPAGLSPEQVASRLHVHPRLLVKSLGFFVGGIAAYCRCCS
jgi:hypothetical protein